MYLTAAKTVVGAAGGNWRAGFDQFGTLWWWGGFLGGAETGSAVLKRDAVRVHALASFS